MAANPIAAVGACCCGTLGIVFVLTFFFASVQTNTDHNKEIDDWIARTTNQSCTVTNVHETDSESCRILNQTTTQRDCFEQHSCVCGSCVYGSSFCSVPLCSERQAVAGSSGSCISTNQCCAAEACVEECYWAEYEYEDVYICDSCAYTECAQYNFVQCTVDWYQCYLIQWAFQINEDAATGRSYGSTAHHDCVYAASETCKSTYEAQYTVNNNVSCWYVPSNTNNPNLQEGSVAFSSPSSWPYFVYFYRDEAPSSTYPPYAGSGTNSNFDALYSQFSVGQSVECWYDPLEDDVYFEEPNDDGKKSLTGGWVGVGFGIAFILIAVVLVIVFCIQMQLGNERRAVMRNRQQNYKAQEMSTTSRQDQASMPVAHAVAVPM